LRKWKMDSWIRPLFSQTLQLSHGQNSLKSWLEEFSRSGGLVSQSAPLENAKQPKMNGGSSTSLQMELPLCDRESYSLKTSKDSFQPRCQMGLQSLATASRDWKAYITELRQAYSARLKSAHRISESESSSLPTISVNESKNSIGGSQMERNSIPLGTMAAMHGPAVPASSSTDGSRPESWQTATVSTGAHRQKDGSMIDKLDQQVKRWATPDASDRRSDKSRQVGLSNQTKTWPTAASAGVTGGPTGLAGGSGNREKLASMLPDAEARAMGCGKLNPRWVCTLMNVPVFWVKP
jgi:hypothetical protein